MVGSVAIDGEDLGNNEAHLRWFILDDACRGTGIGRQLLACAMQFAINSSSRQYNFGPSVAFTLHDVFMNLSASG